MLAATSENYLPMVTQSGLRWGVSELREYDTAAIEELSDLLGGHRHGGLPQPAMVVNPWPPTARPRYAAQPSPHDVVARITALAG